MSNEQQTAKNIAKKLHDHGYIAYFAGGCVRDQFLGKVAKDYDIATNATPDQVLELFPGANSIGAHFGVILVKQDGEHFEIATFRTDGSYNDNRRPESVTFSSPTEDAQRRDFTINGCFLDPATDEILDFVEGKNDLDVRVIRAIGDPEERFQEDALRLMRAVRFATTLDFQIEPITWQAICDNADLLGNISVERIQAEFNKILLTPNRRRGLELLTDSGLIKHIIPEVLDLIGCEQPPQWHPEGDVYVHTCIMLEMLIPDASIELCLAVLLHDIGKPPCYTYDEADQRIRFNGHDSVGAEMSEEILRRLKYPNQIIEDVRVMVQHHMRFMNVMDMKTAKLKRFMARETFPQEMELHRVDCGSSNGFTENYDFLKNKQEEYANQPIIPAPLVTGKDLIDRGMSPGPAFKKILKDIQTEQLEGRLTEREEALIWLEGNL